MAHLKDILETENKRTSDAECRQIYLYQEGTFYRAYERSAWLLISYISPLKPTRRNVKGQDDSIVFCGFPITSLTKYVKEDCTIIDNEDKSQIITIPATLYPSIESTEAEQAAFSYWKQSVPLTESKKEVIKESNTTNTPLRLTDIMHKILVYPIEQKSPLESMQFLAEIKQQIATIL